MSEDTSSQKQIWEMCLIKMRQKEDIKNAENPEYIADETAVITEGLSIKGDLDSLGSIDLFGSVEGNVTCRGKLTVSGSITGSSKANEFFANDAQVDGDIEAKGAVKIGQGTVVVGNITATSAVIGGAVKGDIDVHGPVIIDSSAIISGDIKSKSVQINNGATIDGRCSQCYADVNMESIFDIKGKRINNWRHVWITLKRVILKLSGEALAKKEGGYNDELIENIANQVKTIVDKGTDVGVVIGGGNYWRGTS